MAKSAELSNEFCGQVPWRLLYHISHHCLTKPNVSSTPATRKCSIREERATQTTLPTQETTLLFTAGECEQNPQNCERCQVNVSLFYNTFQQMSDLLMFTRREKMEHGKTANKCTFILGINSPRLISHTLFTYSITHKLPFACLISTAQLGMENEMPFALEWWVFTPGAGRMESGRPDKEKRSLKSSSLKHHDCVMNQSNRRCTRWVVPQPNWSSGLIYITLMNR